MQATYVEARRTPYTFEEAAEAMRAALGGTLSARPRDEVLALALAKSALETGRWKSTWCHNWGNIKAGSSYAGMYCCIELNEVLNGKVVWFGPGGRLAGGRGSAVASEPFAVPPGHPQTRMRAYANRFDGAYAYVGFVSGIKRYAASWQALLAGDPVGYVHALKLANYFTADELPYRKAVVSLHTEFLAKLRGHGWSTEEPDPGWDRLRVLAVSQQFDTLEMLHADKMREFAGIESQRPGDDLKEGGGENV